MTRSVHIGVFVRSRPWKRGLSVWAGPPSVIELIRFTYTLCGSTTSAS
jgi:hypothetical protein